MRRIGKVLPDGMRCRLRYAWRIVDDIRQGVRLNSKVKCVKNIYIVKNLFRPELCILFYPNRLAKFYTIYKIITLLGFRIVYELDKAYDLVVKWKDATYTDPLPASLRDKPVINADCIDISKAYISKIFFDVFGYSISVDPLRYKGMMVVKSNKNFAHDGRIIKGPLSKTEEDKVYQRLVDSIDPETGLAVDFRVPVFGDMIPIIWKKYKQIDERFGRNVIFREIAYPYEVFSEEELEKIIKVAQVMNLDYGEMDVLRDRRTGKIYIVDVNNTPAIDKTLDYFLSKDPDEAHVLMKALCKGFVELIKKKGIYNAKFLQIT
ncbi:hypothetical protein [Rhodothermus profundi]|uniref:hypothetical protein n=1 Tax=Rhodothermus profundi TaxID=633813 RepID=UPI0015C15852|nr:hypothetical protein [Rhodothermus profundi]